MPEVGTFQCPVCYQKYDSPPTPIILIVGHMKEAHGLDRTEDWVRGKLQ